MIDAAVQQKMRMFLLAGVLGGLVGGTTAGFLALAGEVQRLLYGSASEKYFATIAAAVPGWRLLLATTLGGLLLGLILHFFIPGRRYHGIADVMEACALRGARMDVRSGIGAGIAAAVSIGSGASVGREGPAVHIGASLSAWIAEKLGLTQRDSLTLLGCGAAAAVTASFNAPIAGVLFALEVVVGYYALGVFAPIVLASMGAVVVTRLLLGDYPAFSVPDYTLTSLWELPAFALLGIGGALVALALIRGIGSVQRICNRLHLPIWLRPALGGLLIGVIALWYPQVLSVGYEATSAALNGALAFALLVALLLAKWAATSLALGSGFAGGVFSPALFLGAMFGGAFWHAASQVFPELASTQGAYAIVGMAAVASAMLGAPLSTLLIVFELTLDYHLTVAVMLAAAMASTVMQATGNRSFFRWQLAQRGIDVVAGRDQGLLVASSIEPLVRGDFSRVSAAVSLADVQRLLLADGVRVAMLVADGDRLHGSLSLPELLHAAVSQGLDAAAAAVAQGAEVSVPRHTSLNGALDAMRSRDLQYLPVVDELEGEGRVVGVIYRDEVLDACNKVLREARAEESGLS